VLVKERIVRTGSMHDCATCGDRIPTGALALRRSRRAGTYHERLHADADGNVRWYHHVTCARPAGEVCSDLLSQRRALVADLRSCGSDRLTRATIEAQIKMLDLKIAEARNRRGS
jgi:hypothetical protein